MSTYIYQTFQLELSNRKHQKSDMFVALGKILENSNKNNSLFPCICVNLKSFLLNLLPISDTS